MAARFLSKRSNGELSAVMAGTTGYSETFEPGNLVRALLDELNNGSRSAHPIRKPRITIRLNIRKKKMQGAECPQLPERVIEIMAPYGGAEEFIRAIAPNARYPTSQTHVKNLTEIIGKEGRAYVEGSAITTAVLVALHLDDRVTTLFSEKCLWRHVQAQSAESRVVRQEKSRSFGGRRASLEPVVTPPAAAPIIDKVLPTPTYELMPPGFASVAARHDHDFDKLVELLPREN